MYNYIRKDCAGFVILYILINTKSAHLILGILTATIYCVVAFKPYSKNNITNPAHYLQSRHTSHPGRFCIKLKSPKIHINAIINKLT